MTPADLPRAALCVSLLDTIISSMSPSSGNAPFWLMTDAAQELIQTAKGRVYRVTHRTAAAAARAAAAAPPPRNKTAAKGRRSAAGAPHA